MSVKLNVFEWGRVVALPRHKFVTGATLLQLVWPGANNQLDYNTVPDIQKYYLDGSNIHIVLIIP